MTIAVKTATLAVPHDTVFQAFVNRMANDFAKFKGPLFVTDVEDVFAVYLRKIPAADRQHHTCNACRRFMNNYGGVVAVNEEGKLYSPFWNADAAPEYYKPAIRAIIRYVTAGTITGVFKSKEVMLGTPTDGGWSHFAAVNPAPWTNRIQTDYQNAAEKLEDFKNVIRALGEFKLEHLNTAVQLLEAEALYRSEKVLGQAKWLQELKPVKNPNLLWKAVAVAPAGFCHPRASMIGTLLEDLESGMPIARAQSRFADKMRPDKYMRPVAAPAEQTIERAEAIVEKLGIAQSLQRRYARFEELELVWSPTQKSVYDVAAPSVFGHLKAKAPEAPVAPSVTMTWVKFREKVLPQASKIEYQTGDRQDPYGAYVTAVHPDAPCLMQWGTHFSYFVFTNGSRPAEWGLSLYQYIEVTGISLAPHMWGGREPGNHGKGGMFVLKGAQCQRSGIGSALFPEDLKSEMHGVRSVIEAHSKSVDLEGRTEATACGLLMSSTFNRTFRVTTPNGTGLYTIDRWD